MATSVSSSNPIGGRAGPLRRARQSVRRGEHGRPLRTNLLKRLEGSGGVHSKTAMAVVCHGECYADDSDDDRACNTSGRAEYVWRSPVVVKLEYAPSVNNDGEPGIRARGKLTGYAGFDTQTGLYWRYADEAEGGGGEHCMKVIHIIGPRESASGLW